jgi:hypothetical protein
LAKGLALLSVTRKAPFPVVVKARPVPSPESLSSSARMGIAERRVTVALEQLAVPRGAHRGGVEASVHGRLLADQRIVLASPHLVQLEHVVA